MVSKEERVMMSEKLLVYILYVRVNIYLMVKTSKSGEYTSYNTSDEVLDSESDGQSDFGTYCGTLMAAQSLSRSLTYLLKSPYDKLSGRG